MAEIAAFFVLAMAADYFLFGADRFASVQPHPFWAIVLLAAAQYGSAEALFAAAVATALVLTEMPEQGFDEDFNAWLLRVTITPALWFLAALVLGEIHDGDRRERDRIAEHLKTARKEAQAITDAYERLAQIKGELDARVAGQVRTVRAMYEASRAIDGKNTSEVIVGIANLVRAVPRAEEVLPFLLGCVRARIGRSLWLDFVRRLCGGVQCVLSPVPGGDREPRNAGSGEPRA